MPARRKDLPREEIRFNGKTYYRYPTSSNISDTKYFRSGGKYLHRDIWEYYNGEIPKGYQVHHCDSDPANNNLSNLVLVKAGEHIRDYHKPTGEYLARLQAHAKRIGPLTKEWHKSRRGKDWHKRQARKNWTKRQSKVVTCIVCDNEYETKVFRENARFCSSGCKSKYRRDLGLDNETRICIRCNNEFATNKYSKAVHCSRACVEATKRIKKDILQRVSSGGCL